MATRYVHTNLIARDWRALSSFYVRLFDCKPVLPERDLSGDWLDAGTGIEKSHITGIHLRLPGHGETGPTLEIFSYDDVPAHPAIAPNTPGFAHVAFLVDDVPTMAAAVLAAGGSAVGGVATRDVPGVGRLIFQYMRDPEGNIIELLHWK